MRFRSAGTDTTDVWAAGSVRSLDDSKRFLDRAPWQTLAQALLRSTTGTGTTILVGVINGHAERRAPFRCEFAQLLPSRGRLRFVVGSDAPALEILAKAVPAICDCGNWARATDALQGDRPC